MTDSALLADRADLLRVADAIAIRWRAAGIAGSLHARNVDTDEHLGIDVDRPCVLASVVKVPIALAALAQISAGQLDPARPVRIDPAASALGAAGVSLFQHPATITVVDLVALMLTVSDNAAADHLLDLVAPSEVQRALLDWGYPEIRVRHRMQPMYDAASVASSGDAGLAIELAIASGCGEGSVIEMLDPTRANVGTARSLTGLLADVWADRIADPLATAELRRLMRKQVYTQRLSSELRSDDVRVAGKTGSFLHLRHEIGVAESRDGDRVAIAALTTSTHRATLAPEVDLEIGAAARDAYEVLRR